jgi:hypothetical protein
MNRLLLALVAMLVASCDPAHDAAVDDLGGEAPGVPRGPTHRPGQPCTVCHGGDGPGKPTFSVAGTVYRSRSDATGVQGAVVTITDADGAARSFGTNEVGTYYEQESTWKPRFPLKAKVSFGGVETEMKTPINGDGSCGLCHRDPAGRDSVGHVFVTPDPVVTP